MCYTETQNIIFKIHRYCYSIDANVCRRYSIHETSYQIQTAKPLNTKHLTSINSDRIVHLIDKKHLEFHCMLPIRLHFSVIWLDGYKNIKWFRILLTSSDITNYIKILIISFLLLLFNIKLVVSCSFTRVVDLQLPTYQVSLESIY